MMVAPEALLEHGRELLRRARVERASWEQVRPKLEAGADGGQQDLHERERLQLTWALQYDGAAGGGAGGVSDEARDGSKDGSLGGPSDGELVRFALEQEVRWREVSPSQGIGEALEILAWLVARDRLVEDVWLLARAKRANFDCGCGFDLEHLVSGGVDATLAQVRASTRPEREAVLGLLLDASGAPALEELAVLDWLSRKARGFVRTPAEEPTEVWLGRAIELGERGLAKQLLEQWSEGCDRSVEFLQARAGYLAELGEHGDEADVRTTLLAYLATPFDRAGELCRAAAASRRAERWANAFEHLDHAALLHRVRHGWRELGLGRELVRELFELAAASPEPVARQAFVIGEELAAVTPRLPPVALEHAARAAARLGEPERQRAYEAQLAAARAEPAAS